MDIDRRPGRRPLRALHGDTTLSPVTLERYRKHSTEEIIESLRPGLRYSLQVKLDGTVMDGNHRIFVLRERGIDVDSLPREFPEG